jgi:aminoglycoside phosphotransferase (APT) family kinase protein
VRYDSDLFFEWFAVAREQHPAAAPLGDALAAAAGRLAALPQTLIHGELYPSNVLVGGARVAVVDWETAGLGPGILDLAALVVGWDPDSRGEIVGAYDPSTDPRDLAAAELVLALRCLSLPPTREPPEEHRRDWLAEARTSARMLG